MRRSIFEERVPNQISIGGGLGTVGTYLSASHGTATLMPSDEGALIRREDEKGAPVWPIKDGKDSFASALVPTQSHDL